MWWKWHVHCRSENVKILTVNLSLSSYRLVKLVKSAPSWRHAHLQSSAGGVSWRHAQISSSARVASRHSQKRSLSRARVSHSSRRWSSTEIVRCSRVFWTGTVMWWPVRSTCCPSTALLPPGLRCLTRIRAGAAREALRTAPTVIKQININFKYLIKLTVLKQFCQLNNCVAKLTTFQTTLATFSSKST